MFNEYCNSKHECKIRNWRKNFLICETEKNKPSPVLKLCMAAKNKTINWALFILSKLNYLICKLWRMRGVWLTVCFLHYFWYTPSPFFAIRRGCVMNCSNFYYFALFLRVTFVRVGTLYNNTKYKQFINVKLFVLRMYCMYSRVSNNRKHLLKVS